MKHFLSEEECDHLISAAKTEGLINSATEKNSDDRDPRNFVLMDINEDKQLSIEEVSYCFYLMSAHALISTCRSSLWFGHTI